jgi:glycosyltransferase involved in cell wall biosynthesis
MRLISDIAPNVPRVIVPCAVNTADFGALPPPHEFRERHLAGYSGPLVVFLGRVTEKKGVDVLLRSLAYVLKRQPARLAVVGPDDGGQRPRLQRLAEDLGISSEVDSSAGSTAGSPAALSAADSGPLIAYGELDAVIEAIRRLPVVVSREVNLGRSWQSERGIGADAAPRAFAADY